MDDGLGLGPRRGRGRLPVIRDALGLGLTGTLPVPALPFQQPPQKVTVERFGPSRPGWPRRLNSFLLRVDGQDDRSPVSPLGRGGRHALRGLDPPPVWDLIRALIKAKDTGFQVEIIRVLGGLGEGTGSPITVAWPNSGRAAIRPSGRRSSRRSSPWGRHRWIDVVAQGWGHRRRPDPARPGPGVPTVRPDSECACPKGPATTTGSEASGFLARPREREPSGSGDAGAEMTGADSTSPRRTLRRSVDQTTRARRPSDASVDPTDAQRAAPLSCGADGLSPVSPCVGPLSRINSYSGPSPSFPRSRAVPT